MCEFCDNSKTIMKMEVLSIGMVNWCSDSKAKEMIGMEYPLGVFIDSRGYLRMVDLDDCNCLDGGEKVKISFCPFCGKNIKKEC